MDKPLVTIKYKTADGGEICVEVSTSVKELLDQSDRQIRTQRRQDRRHLDFAIRTDESLSSPLLPAHEDTADIVERIEHNTELHKAISKLTKIQQRRLRLYYFDGLSYSQIARMENVSHRAVMYSIEQALKSLKKLCQT